MFRTSIITMFFTALFCQSSLAATVSPSAAPTFRYEFDVLSSFIGFQSLRMLDDDEPIALDDRLYAAAVQEFNVIADLTGRNVLEITDTFQFDPVNSADGGINCIKGFICPNSRAAFPSENGFSTDIGGGFEWDLIVGENGSGLLTFFDDVNIFTGGTVNGFDLFAAGPIGRFELRNVSVTEVSQVPLPAGFPLLALGLGGIALVGRHRKSAT